jgi:hypothetical protein
MRRRNKEEEGRMERRGKYKEDIEKDREERQSTSRSFRLERWKEEEGGRRKGKPLVVPRRISHHFKLSTYYDKAISLIHCRQIGIYKALDARKYVFMSSAFRIEPALPT